MREIRGDIDKKDQADAVCWVQVGQSRASARVKVVRVKVAR